MRSTLRMFLYVFIWHDHRSTQNILTLEANHCWASSTLDMTLEQNDARFYHKKLSEQWSGNSSRCDWPAAFLIILSNLYPCRNNAEVALPVSTSQIQLKGWSHHGSCHLEIRRFSYVLCTGIQSDPLKNQSDPARLRCAQALRLGKPELVNVLARPS